MQVANGCNYYQQTSLKTYDNVVINRVNFVYIVQTNVNYV